jgi:hypothetical protein
VVRHHAQAPDGSPPLSAVVLVEGVSDRCALEALAERRGRSLALEGVSIVPMGGATNIGHFLERLGPHGLDLRLSGLYDEAEEGYIRRGLERAGLGSGLSGDDLQALGFFRCVHDLEDELIRSLGVDRVEATVQQQGELAALRILQRQPAQRGRSATEQLRRFMGTRSGRKSRYARLLVEALDVDRVPRPLDQALAHA